jgi:lysophospholipase L1-like esterase
MRLFPYVLAAALGGVLGCGDGAGASGDASGGGRDTGARDGGARDGGGDGGRGDAGSDAAMLADAGQDAGPEGDAGTDADVDGGPRTAASCFDGVFASTPTDGPDYDRFGPTVASHCFGTDQQEITGVERVVFLGDSVTVGTPPSLTDQLYRNILAEELADRFGLDRPLFDYALWQRVDVLNGVTYRRDAGPFSSCAEWGARTDDFLPESAGDTAYQMGDCFPADRRDETTLVIMTMGGNDIASITKDGFDRVRTVDELWEDTRAFVQRQRDAVAWLRDPANFSAPVYVVFGNMYEFTDATGDVESCPAAEAGGFGGSWEDPDALHDMVVWAEEQYLAIAVEHRVDMIFMLEAFCGHGYHSDDPAAPCYRGPGTERWFDLSCTHPNPTGHQAIADMFMAVVDE